jgi:fermentation-respiration switch protein FrsA (DUF1100 family)
MVVTDIGLSVETFKLAGQLYLPGDGGQSTYPTVCICHGIPAGIPDSNDRGYPLLAERICGQGFSVFIFNFRGSGLSGGNFDILGWTSDLSAVIDYLWALAEVDRPRLYLLGFSGGAAVSIYVGAQDERVSAIAACACPAEFTFISDDARSAVEYFRSIGTIRDEDFPRSAKEWLNGFRLVSPINYVAEIAPRPLLLVHGSQDETVEVNHAYRLYDRAGEPKRLVIIEGAEHRLRQNEEAMNTVIEWLKSRAEIH